MNPLSRVLFPAFVFGALLGCSDVVKYKCVDENSGEQVSCEGKTKVDEGGSDSGGSTTGADKPDPDRVNTTCEGACEWYFNPADACQCDEYCFNNGDCCSDFEEFCSDMMGDGTGDSGSDSPSTDGGTGGTSTDYEFPQPYDVTQLSYKDCKGIASGNYSWCDTFDCKGIVTWQKTWCSKADCRGIAAADRSWCSSKDCKALADSRKCELTHKDDKEALKACKQEARGWCDSYDCKAMSTGYASDCKSSNCKAIVKGDYSYCFQKRDVGP
jgi:hypothetical protein